LPARINPPINNREINWNINHDDYILEGNRDTYRINTDAYSYFYTYCDDQEIEAWVYDQPDMDGNYRHLFIRDFGVPENQSPQRPVNRHGSQAGTTLEQGDSAILVPEHYSALEQK